jgi:hypothetical protein
MFGLCQAIASARTAYEMVAGKRPYPEDGTADFSDGENLLRAQGVVHYQFLFDFSVFLSTAR